jgi:hypothetical protein
MLLDGFEKYNYIICFNINNAYCKCIHKFHLCTFYSIKEYNVHSLYRYKRDGWTPTLRIVSSQWTISAIIELQSG